MKGWRKLIIAVLSLALYTVILLIRQYDPFALGAGIGTFLATVMYGYHQEYKNGGK